MNRTAIPDIDAEIPENAVSIYGPGDAMDDFPVLKAFQQYIAMEQNKARKRLLVMCTFFGFIIILLTAVFAILLLGANSRNQTLNDRLVEYAMRDRERASKAPVTCLPAQDNGAINALTAKLDEMQRKLDENQLKTEKIAAEAEARVKKAETEAAKPKPPSKEEKEIIRLKALLEAEREKNSAEREKQHQAEIEAYRRKYYPEFYEQKKPTENHLEDVQREAAAADAEIEAILHDADAIQYFDEQDSHDKKPARKSKVQKDPSSVPSEDTYSIPVEIKGSSSNWSIPLD